MYSLHQKKYKRISAILRIDKNTKIYTEIINSSIFRMSNLTFREIGLGAREIEDRLNINEDTVIIKFMTEVTELVQAILALDNSVHDFSDPEEEFEQFKGEIGDVMMNLASLCVRYSIDLDTIFSLAVVFGQEYSLPRSLKANHLSTAANTGFIDTLQKYRGVYSKKRVSIKIVTMQVRELCQEMVAIANAEKINPTELRTFATNTLEKFRERESLYRAVRDQ